MTKTRARVPATLRPSSRDELEQLREGKVVTAPSGARYRIRRINLERHALSGGLPASLVQVAMEGQEAIGKLFEQIAQGDSNADRRETVLGYLDRLVLATVIDPPLTEEDLGDPSDLTSDALLPADDYKFFVGIAMGEVDYDAADQRIWGVDPLSRFPAVSEVAGGGTGDASGL